MSKQDPYISRQSCDITSITDWGTARSLACFTLCVNIGGWSLVQNAPNAPNSHADLCCFLWLENRAVSIFLLQQALKQNAILCLKFKWNSLTLVVCGAFQLQMPPCRVWVKFHSVQGSSSLLDCDRLQFTVALNNIQPHYMPAKIYLLCKDIMKKWRPEQRIKPNTFVYVNLPADFDLPVYYRPILC